MTGLEMNVFALLTDGYGTSGGIAQYNRDLLRALSLSPVVGKIDILPRYGAASAEAPNKVRQLRAVPGRAAYSLGALRHAASTRFQAVFCGHLFVAPLAAAIARLANCPLWLQVHGIEAWTPPRTATQSAVRSAALVTAVSRHTRRRLLEWSDIEPERVRVLPNTVSDNYYHRPRRVDLTARHGLRGRKVILTVGRLSAGERYKGHDRVMKSLPRVSRCHPEVSYLVVGDGDDLPRLQAEATALGVADRVIFAGHVANEELADYFALADVFAMPSTGEGFGIVFLEAAAAGLPVIGGNRDGSVDALADGHIGQPIDPHDMEGLAVALGKALQGRPGTKSNEIGRFAFDNFASYVHEYIQNLA